MSALRLTPSKSHGPDRLAAESRTSRGTKLHGSRMSRATIIRRPKNKIFLPSSPPPRLGTEPHQYQTRGTAPRPRLPCLRRIACPETATLSEGHCARRGCEAFFLFVLSGECSLGAHGLLRFRTNDVLLGTSGVGVCVSVVSNSPGMLYRSPNPTSLTHEAISGWLPCRER